METFTADGVDVAARIRIPQHVVHRAFATETVMLNLQTGQYHGIDPVGARMLEVLVTSASLRDAASVLAAEQRCERAQLEVVLGRFCRRLADRDLVKIDGF